MCDRDFRFLESEKFKTSWVLFNHWRWRSAMAEGAGAGLMQQSGQDLASWKCFSYIYCARGGKSHCWWYRASCHRVIVVPSFKSVHFHFQQGVLLDAVRLICAAQPAFFWLGSAKPKKKKKERAFFPKLEIRKCLCEGIIWGSQWDSFGIDSSTRL